MKHLVTTILTTSLWAVIASINVLQAKDTGNTSTIVDPGTLPTDTSTSAQRVVKCALPTLSPDLRLEIPIVHYRSNTPDSLFLSVKLQGSFLPNTEETQMWFQVIDSG